MARSCAHTHDGAARVERLGLSVREICRAQKISRASLYRALAGSERARKNLRKKLPAEVFALLLGADS